MGCGGGRGVGCRRGTSSPSVDDPFVVGVHCFVALSVLQTNKMDARLNKYINECIKQCINYSKIIFGYF